MRGYSSSYVVCRLCLVWVSGCFVELCVRCVLCEVCCFAFDVRSLISVVWWFLMLRDFRCYCCLPVAVGSGVVFCVVDDVCCESVVVRCSLIVFGCVGLMRVVYCCGLSIVCSLAMRDNCCMLFAVCCLCLVCRVLIVVRCARFVV